MRNVFSVGVVVGLALLLATWLAIESRAQAPEKASIAGIWLRNDAQSDPPPARGERGERGQNGRGQGRRGGGGGGRGGFGGYGRGGGGGPGQQMPGDPEEMQRMREALRDILNPPERLTITQTESMVVLTAADGRTTRLSPDGKKIKDENTKVERKTRWDGGRLIVEITGTANGKITQTFSVDAETRQLKVVVDAEGGRNQDRRTMTHVYDPDAPR